MKKRIWNRGISLLVAAVMSLTLLAGTGMTAAADASASPISEVSLTIPENLLLVGATYKAADYAADKVQVDSSAGYTVTSFVLQDPGGYLLEDGARLSYRAEYTAIISLAAKTGFRFDANAAVRVNGSDTDVLIVNRDADGDEDERYDELQLTWTFTPIVKAYINAFDLPGVPVATPGQAPVPYSYTFSGGTGTDHYTVTGSWHQYDSALREYVSMAADAVFTDSGAYMLLLNADLKPGYVIHDDDPLVVNVNGQWIPVQDNTEFFWIANQYTTFGAELNTVNFTVPQPVEGTPFSDTPITAAVPSGSHYTVEGKWLDPESGNYAGTFTTGKEYYFEYTVYAGDGYSLADYVTVYINGAYYDELPGSGKFTEGTYRASMKTMITEAVLTNVPTAEPGSTLQPGDIPLTVPEGAKYTAFAYWCDAETGSPITGGQAEAGKRYDRWITLEAAPGYEFAEFIILRINGAAHQIGGGGVTVDHYQEVSFLEQISQVEVTGITAPVVGQAPDTASLQSADPAKYTIIHAVWIDAATGTDVTVFENGGTYALQVFVTAQPGYEFAPNIPWKLGEADGTGEPYPHEMCRLFAEFSFAEVIPEIRVSDIPVVKAGELPETDITVPADAKYDVFAEWRVWDTLSQTWEPFSGPFESGETYVLAIMATPAAGCCFDSDATAVYLNGVQDTDATINTLLASSTIVYAAEGAEVIRRVDISVDQPSAGDHCSVEPGISLPEGCSYSLRRGCMWLEGSLEDPRPFYFGYFAEGKSYGLEFRLIADEGYAFAEDLLVVVNGIALPAEAFSSDAKTLDIDYFFSMSCQHLYDNEEDDTCNVCGYQRERDSGAEGETDDGSPKTGDRSRLSLWVIVLAVSCTAALVLAVRQRRYR